MKKTKKRINEDEQERKGWMLLAEKSLAKTWLTKEEDEAWKDL